MKVPARLPLILTFSRQGRRDYTNTRLEMASMGLAS